MCCVLEWWRTQTKGVQPSMSLPQSPSSWHNYPHPNDPCPCTITLEIMISTWTISRVQFATTQHSHSYAEGQKMDEWVKVLDPKPNSLSSILQYPRWRKELTLTSCLLTFTGMSSNLFKLMKNNLKKKQKQKTV